MQALYREASRLDRAIYNDRSERVKEQARQIKLLRSRVIACKEKMNLTIESPARMPDSLLPGRPEPATGASSDNEGSRRHGRAPSSAMKARM